MPPMTSEAFPVSLCTSTSDVANLMLAVSMPVFLGYLAGSHVRKFRALYHRDVIKPRFMPPAWIFAPAWTISYALMGCASYLVHRAGRVHGVPVTAALACYAAQLAINLCWPVIFFRYRNIKASLYAITTTLLLVLLTMYKFAKVSSEATQLMMPYLVWLTIAGYINKLIWRKNEDNATLSKEKLFSYPSDEMVLMANLQLAKLQYPSVDSKIE